MWPFDIRRKKRESEERQREEERRRAGRYTGRSPAFSAPYGGRPSSAAEPDSTPLFFGAGGYGGEDTSRCSSHDSHTSTSPSCNSGDSGGGSDGGGSCSSSD